MQLIDFDKEFYESIEGKDKIFMSERGHYHTFTVEGKKAGVVGVMPAKIEGSALFQILVAPEFRGKNLTKEAEEMVARKYGITEMLATIKKDNIASIKAHEKAGFEHLPESKLEELRQRGFLDNDKIRMRKKIN